MNDELKNLTDALNSAGFVIKSFEDLGFGDFDISVKRVYTKAELGMPDEDKQETA